ncbi:ABC transporter ATP-binding protein [Atopobium sp. oral taxon 810]|uniref:ABC transporter ATP-binding protein n=1 Tax=Atopobium sp. oral taxon 810 TaxID=712158 RepID=UPI000396BC9D|nr:ABC transporter ATP-binding protein [Atopobium sp. oral taxon 810]ERI04020.1 ABC transporter, ATP-binding protein [Atopobium sp. oral taxon 810 str. F0209]
MSDHIDIWGVKTNNLKSIDVSIKKHAINLIIGPSGSGKSSLAYETIAQIGQHEYASMFADNVAEPTYRVDGYSNMIASVPIRQSNFNNNMRSTIGTYFGINRSVALVYATRLGLQENFFTLNKEGNLCEECHGLGYISTLDPNRVIDYDVPLAKNPVKCWNRYKDFYCQIIKEYCVERGIDPSKTFRDLSESERHEFLYGESAGKFSIRYKKTGSFSRRTTKFYGIMTSTPMMVGFTPAKRFYSDVTCDSCHGKRYAPLFNDYKVAGLSIGEFMTMPFETLMAHVERIKDDGSSSGAAFAIKRIHAFLSKAVELNLGHLSLNRSIPTLSGGELQRLRMVQLFNAQLSDMLVVLDEPLAGLSGEERDSVFDNIVNLASKHTIVVVDHSEIFVNHAQNIIALGEGGGRNGGKLIDVEAFLERQRKPLSLTVVKPKRMIQLVSHNSVYNFTGIDVSIGENALNLVSGPSGVGKSTLLREYLPQHFDHYLYVNQRPLTGNKYSHVATLLDIFIRITELFAAKYKKDRKYFTNQLGCDGACPVCSGAGYLDYGDGTSRSRIECGECGGTGFHKRLVKYALDGKTMSDIWRMTIDEAAEFFRDKDKRISETLGAASDLMLGHLVLGQSSESLSGGENIRIKLLKSMGTASKFIGVDEPFKGLSNEEIYRVAEYLDALRAKGKTVIVVDHTDNAVKYFGTRIVLANVEGILQG